MSMLSNNQLKWVRSLHQKKFREEEGCFLAEGYKVVEEALQTGMTVSLIAGTPEFLHRMKSHPAASAGIEFVECTRQQLDRMSSLSTAPDGLAVIRKPSTTLDEVVPSDHLVLVLDGIRDPGNMGTILRIADWFGLPSLVVSEDTVEEFNPKVVQAAMGSLFRTKIRRTKLDTFLAAYIAATAHPVLAATMDGPDLFKSRFPKSACLVLGNESEGIRPEVLSCCTERISIPGYFKSGQGPESLNVAVSSAVLLAEYRRVHPDQ